MKGPDEDGVPLKQSKLFYFYHIREMAVNKLERREKTQIRLTYLKAGDVFDVKFQMAHIFLATEADKTGNYFKSLQLNFMEKYQ